ncbi:MAG: Uma2 family endonuclease [Mobilicoccus sp.]|nr:Uma2 family endonuclease [Mobilicoccus sp.]
MSTTATMTLDQFDAWAQTRDETWELIDGVPHMVPPESIRNLDVAMALRDQLLAQMPARAYRILPQAGVDLRSGSTPSMRVPDLVVAPRIGQPPLRFSSAEVLLVVEVLSPSTAHTDLVDKRADYAAAGVPAYLIIDTRHDMPALTLHDEHGTTTGEHITLHIDGHAIDIDATDLTP